MRHTHISARGAYGQNSQSVLLWLHCNATDCGYNTSIYYKQENIIPSHSSSIRNGLRHGCTDFPTNLRSSSKFYPSEVWYERSYKLSPPPPRARRRCKKCIYIFFLTANGLVPSGSGATITHTTQSNTPHSNRTQYTKLKNSKDTYCTQ
jgi:hypothetical protein